MHTHIHRDSHVYLAHNACTCVTSVIYCNTHLGLAYLMVHAFLFVLVHIFQQCEKEGTDRLFCVASLIRASAFAIELIDVAGLFSSPPVRQVKY